MKIGPLSIFGSENKGVEANFLLNQRRLNSEKDFDSRIAFESILCYNTFEKKKTLTAFAFFYGFTWIFDKTDAKRPFRKEEPHGAEE